MNIKNLLILSMVKHVGPAYVKKNIARLSQESDCIKIVHEVSPSELDNLDYYAQAAEEIISVCHKNNIEMISIFDLSYPQQLLEISDPPSVLYLKGNKSLLQQVFAIIGTRRSTELGNKIAEKVGQYFSLHFAICNGLVEGIDEHAIYIEGKVSKNVVGVISGGLCYRETCSEPHVRVIEDVLLAGGLIVSEFPPYQKEDAYSGSKASRIQAGLSHGLILIQSKVDGGSKYTLAKYSKLGRPIGIIHYPSSKEYATDVFGANRLILEKGKEGIGQMLDIKKGSTLNVGEILAISDKSDYEKLIKVTQSHMFGKLF